MAPIIPDSAPLPVLVEARYFFLIAFASVAHSSGTTFVRSSSAHTLRSKLSVVLSFNQGKTLSSVLLRTSNLTSLGCLLISWLSSSTSPRVARSRPDLPPGPVRVLSFLPAARLREYVTVLAALLSSFKAVGGREW